ncbi:MAG: cupin domain-containing protein [Roseitalea sp.]|jgi:mannose-6-phosphate isomerase-like protein (cupin superfamily)|nr:cupin domain-containing protein [Roseitalea sp.]MBO6723440.1 cupin domain-containing protein [Roseitalea sp.]MBO6742496.1 cupin domain-containing protein [Roseitalea sp.]
MPAHIAYHWHHHDQEDEFFFVISGRLLIDLEDEMIELGPNQVHRSAQGRSPYACA